MYKVKRFSQMTIEQREYGLKSKLISKVNNKFTKDIKDMRSAIMTAKRNAEDNGVHNKKVRNNLLRVGHNNNARTIDASLEKSHKSIENSNIRPKDLDKSTLEILDGKYEPSSHIPGKVKNAVKSGKSVIFHPAESGEELLAHEVGHVVNRNSKNPISRAISDSDIANTHLYIDFKDSKGLLNVAKGFVKGKTRLYEETKANKRAMKLLKDAGASEDELKRSKDILDKNLETYKIGSRLSYLFPLKNTLK